MCSGPGVGQDALSAAWTRASSAGPRRRDGPRRPSPFACVELRAGLLEVDVVRHLGVARPGSRPGCRPPRGSPRRPPPPTLAVGGLDLDDAVRQQREHRHVVRPGCRPRRSAVRAMTIFASPDHTSRSAATSSTCSRSSLTRTPYSLSRTSGSRSASRLRGAGTSRDAALRDSEVLLDLGPLPLDVVETAAHEERLLGDVVVLTVGDLVERLDGVARSGPSNPRGR